MHSRANKPSNSSDFLIPALESRWAGSAYYSPKGSFLSEALDSLHCVRFSKLERLKQLMNASGMRFGSFSLDRGGRLVSNSSCRGSNPSASASHSCDRPGFPRDAKTGRKSGLFAHSLSSLDFGLAGGDRFDHDCRPMGAVISVTDKHLSICLSVLGHRDRPEGTFAET